MNILVTGSAGFIASHLVKQLLNDGHYVIGIDNFDPFYSRNIKENNISTHLEKNNFKFIEGDIRDKDLLNVIFKTFNINVVVHLAAKAGVRPSMQDPVGYSSNNVEGTTILLECMRSNGIENIVFASSSSVYGAETKVPFIEKAKLDSIISMYALTKKAGEDIMHLYHKVYGFSVVCLRFFTVYGPGQRPDLAIRKFVSSIEKGEEITVYGDGNTGRDYTYVEDTVSGIVAAVDLVQKKNPLFETINLGNSSPVVLHELISAIEDVVGKKAQKKYIDLPLGDVPITYADINKAKKLLNYNPKTDLRQGLASFYKWYLKNG